MNKIIIQILIKFIQFIQLVELLYKNFSEEVLVINKFENLNLYLSYYNYLYYNSICVYYCFTFTIFISYISDRDRDNFGNNCILIIIKINYYITNLY